MVDYVVNFYFLEYNFNVKIGILLSNLKFGDIWKGVEIVFIIL